MITGAFILIAELILKVIWSIFATISFVIPDAIGDAFITLFSYAHVIDSVFPMTAALAAISFLLSVFVIKYFIGIIFMGLHLMPIVGTKSKVKTPSHN